MTFDIHHYLVLCSKRKNQSSKVGTIRFLEEENKDEALSTTFFFKIFSLSLSLVFLVFLSVCFFSFLALKGINMRRRDIVNRRRKKKKKSSERERKNEGTYLGLKPIKNKSEIKTSRKSLNTKKNISSCHFNFLLKDMK